MKPVLILVDGMNIANRSVAAQEIVTRFPADTAEFYECGEQVLPYFYVRMMRDVLEKQKSVVIESSWRDDYVLDLMKGEVKIPSEFRRMLDRIALGCDAVVAYCYSDSRSYASRLATYEQMRPTIQAMEAAWNLAPTNGLQTVKINTSDEGYKIDVDALMDRVRYMERNAGPGIGAWNPGRVVLLVGDRHGPSIQPYKVDTNLAFCDMAKAGSSYWLSQQLESASILEEKLYWINAYDKDGQPTDPNFVQALRPITVLSLGDFAAKWCDSNHIRHEGFRHPQFHKRFMFKDPYPLIDRLKELMEELK